MRGAILALTQHKSTPSLAFPAVSVYGAPIPHVKSGAFREKSGQFHPVAGEQSASSFTEVQPEKE